MSLDRPVPPNPYEMLPAVPAFEVVSDDITDGAPLADAQSAAGGSVSPHLRWSGEPEGTRSFLVTVHDPDAPTPSGFWHWQVRDIPADVHELPTGAGSAGGEQLPSGAAQGPNELGEKAFTGAAPPPGDRPHRYYVAVTALDVPTMDVPADATPAVLSFMSLQHVLGRALIMGTHQVPVDA